MNEIPSPSYLVDDNCQRPGLSYVYHVSATNDQSNKRKQLTAFHPRHSRFAFNPKSHLCVFDKQLYSLLTSHSHRYSPYLTVSRHDDNEVATPGSGRPDRYNTKT